MTPGRPLLRILVTIRDPDTEAEWRQAVTAAEVLLDIDTARTAGLVTGDLAIDADRCRAILREGRTRGVVPRAADVNTLTAELLAQYERKPAMHPCS